MSDCHEVLYDRDGEMVIDLQFGCTHSEDEIIAEERSRRRRILDDMLAEDGKLSDEQLGGGFRKTR